MKRILITGENSYIGTNFQKWVAQYPEEFEVEVISVRGDTWKEKDFSKFDSILHLAGIAHVSTDPKMEEKYYQVNRDLTIAVAKKAKKEKVKQFIFMSSIIVYGDGTTKSRVITRETVPTPSNFYGNSKLQAEKGIESLVSTDFKVAIIRPPMIYGKGSKGNYPKLAKLAKLTPIFPDFPNERSMLYIDNLCELIKIIIDEQEEGIIFPQNEEYVNTGKLVKEIGIVYGRKIRLVRWFNPLIQQCFGISIINKVFGNLVYEKNINNKDFPNYQLVSFKQSINLTEGDLKK